MRKDGSKDSNDSKDSQHLLRRIALVLAGAAMFLVFVALASGHAHASPIQPDIRRLVEEPQGPPPKFEPARAGWNGPESASPAGSTQELLRAAQVRAVHRTLALAVIPDPKALAAIFLLIVLLRKLRDSRAAGKPEAPPSLGSEWQMPQVA